MKHVLFLMAIVISLSGCGRNAKDYQVINREKRGGAERLSMIESREISGSMEFPGQAPLHFELLIRDGKVRMLSGNETTAAARLFDGSDAWTIVPGIRRPVAMPPFETRTLMTIAEAYSGVLNEWHIQGVPARYMSREKINGTRGYLLEAGEGPQRRVLFLDGRTFLERKIFSGGGVKDDVAEIRMDDYRPVSGVLHPFRLEIYLNGKLFGVLRAEKFILNIPEISGEFDPDDLILPAFSGEDTL